MEKWIYVLSDKFKIYILSDIQIFLEAKVLPLTHTEKAKNDIFLMKVFTNTYFTLPYNYFYIQSIKYIQFNKNNDH